MTTQEISDQVAEEKINYDKLRMAHHISPLENPVELKEKRKLNPTSVVEFFRQFVMYVFL